MTARRYRGPPRAPSPAARRVAVSAQWLEGRADRFRGNAGAVRVVEHLGEVRVGSIAVVEREPDDKSFLPALVSGLRRFASWNGCERVVIDNASPSGIRSGLGQSANVLSA